MRKDAEAHAEEDRKRKELIEARNNADNTAYAAEKAMREFGDKVPADVRSEVEAKVAEVKKAAQGEDVDTIKVRDGSLGSGHSEDRRQLSIRTRVRSRRAGEAGTRSRSEPKPDLMLWMVK